MMVVDICHGIADDQLQQLAMLLLPKCDVIKFFYLFLIILSISPYFKAASGLI
jgi:hypothetical protein